jgi:DNA invertase Pin-like site-specific DNA recombinase
MAPLARQERVRISERTKAGLQRARRSGKKLGRPKVAVDVAQLRRLQAEGLSFRQIGAKKPLSLSTVARNLAASNIGLLILGAEERALLINAQIGNNS